MADSSRSASRGREAFHSSGRGGLGNIRQTSLSRDARPEDGPDDFSSTRGRERIVNPTELYSTGRGGVGNLRSPSRDPNKPVVDPVEQEVIKEYIAAHEGAVHSSGRGGIGNIFNRSRSREPTAVIDRSRSRDPHLHSSGRGGAGNIHHGDGHIAETIDEDERKHAHATHCDGVHSTGRGGAANITSTHEPAVEHHTHPAHHFLSTGRGGAGNITSDRSPSRPRP